MESPSKKNLLDPLQKKKTHDIWDGGPSNSAKKPALPSPKKKIDPFFDPNQNSRFS